MKLLQVIVISTCITLSSIALGKDSSDSPAALCGRDKASSEIIPIALKLLRGRPVILLKDSPPKRFLKTPFTAHLFLKRSSYALTITRIVKVGKAKRTVLVPALRSLRRIGVNPRNWKRFRPTEILLCDSQSAPSSDEEQVLEHVEANEKASEEVETTTDFLPESRVRGYAEYYHRKPLSDTEPATRNDFASYNFRLELDLDFSQSIVTKVAATTLVQPTRQELTHLIREDAYLQVSGGVFTLKVGYQLFDWSKQTVLKPLSRLNATALDLYSLEEYKQGELAAYVAAYFDVHSLELVYMPKPRLPTTMGTDSIRSHEPSLGDLNYVWFSKGELAGNHPLIPQHALRLLLTFNAVDLAFVYTSAMERSQPVLVLSEEGSPTAVIRSADTYGLSTAVALGPFILRLEGAYKKLDNKGLENLIMPIEPVSKYSIVATGIDYGVSFLSYGSLQVAIENQVIPDIEMSQRGAVETFQNDAVLKIQIGYKDFSLKLFYLQDLDNAKERLWHSEIEIGLDQNLKLLVDGRKVTVPSDQPNIVGLGVLSDYNYLGIKIKRYF